MSKSLVVIIHHNTIDYTDALYEMLKPYEGDDYEVVVLDNGSHEGKSSKYTTYRSEENTGYGGGLDLSMGLLLENPQYDSVAVLNSDLILHGYNLMKELRKALFSQPDLMVVSPCVIQPKPNQCFWKAMHCWNATEVRIVPSVDFQFVLMKREFVEKVKAFESHYGWVQDMMTSFHCEDNGWKIGIVDWCPIVHLENGTVRANAHLSNYNREAQVEMDQYFQKKGLVERVAKTRAIYGAYTYKPTK